MGRKPPVVLAVGYTLKVWNIRQGGWETIAEVTNPGTATLLAGYLAKLPGESLCELLNRLENGEA